MRTKYFCGLDLCEYEMFSMSLDSDHLTMRNISPNTLNYSKVFEFSRADFIRWFTGYK